MTPEQRPPKITQPGKYETKREEKKIPIAEIKDKIAELLFENKAGKINIENVRLAKEPGEPRTGEEIEECTFIITFSKKVGVKKMGVDMRGDFVVTVRNDASSRFLYVKNSEFKAGKVATHYLKSYVASAERRFSQLSTNLIVFLGQREGKGVKEIKIHRDNFKVILASRVNHPDAALEQNGAGRIGIVVPHTEAAIEKESGVTRPAATLKDSPEVVASLIQKMNEEVLSAASVQRLRDRFAAQLATGSESEKRKAERALAELDKSETLEAWLAARAIYKEQEDVEAYNEVKAIKKKYDDILK